MLNVNKTKQYNDEIKQSQFKARIHYINKLISNDYDYYIKVDKDCMFSATLYEVIKLFGIIIYKKEIGNISISNKVKQLQITCYNECYINIINDISDYWLERNKLVKITENHNVNCNITSKEHYFDLGFDY